MKQSAKNITQNTKLPKSRVFSREFLLSMRNKPECLECPHPSPKDLIAALNNKQWFVARNNNMEEESMLDVEMIVYVPPSRQRSLSVSQQCR